MTDEDVGPTSDFVTTDDEPVEAPTPEPITTSFPKPPEFYKYVKWTYTAEEIEEMRKAHDEFDRAYTEFCKAYKEVQR